MNYGKLEQALFKSKENYLQVKNRDQARRQQIEICYNSLGYTFFEAWEQGVIKIEAPAETLKELNEILNDLKDIKNY